MIQRRAHNRHAPVPMNYEPEYKPKTYTYRPAETKPLKLSDYWMDMYKNLFKGWK